MKKITIILIIVFCLLYLMEVSCLAENPININWGEYWNSSSDATKEAYIGGVKDGIAKCLNKLVPLTAPDSGKGIALGELVDLHNFICEHHQVVITIIDDLYKDPANTYIYLITITEVAYRKLKGEDVEPLLRKAREEALQEQ